MVTSTIEFSTCKKNQNQSSTNHKSGSPGLQSTELGGFIHDSIDPQSLLRLLDCLVMDYCICCAKTDGVTRARLCKNQGKVESAISAVSHRSE